MELKLVTRRKYKLSSHTFNRTFMELKQRKRYFTKITLITFNRTFMELKQVLGNESQTNSKLLIAPLWN